MVVVAIIGVLAFLIAIAGALGASAANGGAAGAGAAGAVAALVRIHAGAAAPCRDRGIRHLADFQRTAMGVGRDLRRLALRYARDRLRRGHGRPRRHRACRLLRLRAGRSPRGIRRGAAAGRISRETAPANAPASAATPAATAAPRPLALAVAILLLCWIALAPAEQYGLIAQLLYPASLGVALVLLFDKATRAWGDKGGAETVREWLLCDLLVVLLLLAFLQPAECLPSRKPMPAVSGTSST